MNKLWRLIDSLQIISTLPLMKVEFPSNVDIVYQFLDGNSNLQFSCSSETESDNTTRFFYYPTKSSHSTQFALSGFESGIIFENIGPTVSNMSLVLLISVGILVFISFLRLFNL